MKAVILAAGLGSRLKKYTKDLPKCLLKLDEYTTILDYQIEMLIKNARLQKEDIYVIGGYKYEKIKKFIEHKYPGVNLIYNKYYKEYNNIYSFYLIEKFIEESFYLLNGDTIFHEEILKNLIENYEENTAFVIDNNLQRLTEESMKVIIDKKTERILKFGKDIEIKKANGEYIGISKFNYRDFLKINKNIKNLIDTGKTYLWYEIGINYSLNKIIAKPIYTNGLQWYEIDTEEDYILGRNIFNTVLNR